MEIIYRVYEILANKKRKYDDNKRIIDQNVCLCNSRDHFKEIMKSMYGEDITFRNSSSLPVGSIFISIISEDVYNTAEYVIVNDYTCSYCNKHFKANKRLLRTGDCWSFSKLKYISSTFYQHQKEEIINYTFCSSTCLEKKAKELANLFNKRLEELGEASDEWIVKQDFVSLSSSGYIYKITKRSTGEQYVGQSTYVPMFRWMQHLRTDRFPIKKLDDYIFEIVEVVNDLDELNNKEAYWINKCKNELGDKCLNKQIPKYDNN